MCDERQNILFYTTAPEHVDCTRTCAQMVKKFVQQTRIGGNKCFLAIRILRSIVPCETQYYMYTVGNHLKGIEHGVRVALFYPKSDAFRRSAVCRDSTVM